MQSPKDHDKFRSRCGHAAEWWTSRGFETQNYIYVWSRRWIRLTSVPQVERKKVPHSSSTSWNISRMQSSFPSRFNFLFIEIRFGWFLLYSSVQNHRKRHNKMESTGSYIQHISPFCQRVKSTSLYQFIHVFGPSCDICYRINSH